MKILNKDLEVLHEKYKPYEEIQKKKSEKYRPILRQFKDSCENHGIITLDQKIDYFVYLYKNNSLKLPKNKDNVNNVNSPNKKIYTKREIERLKQATTSIISIISSITIRFIMKMAGITI